MHPAQISPPSRHLSRTLVPILLLIASYAILALVVVTDINIYTPDSTRYLIWAKSLGALRGFIDTTLPDPARYVVHAPLYPLLLVPGAWLSTHGVIAAKLTTVFCGIIALMLFYTWLRPRSGTSLAAIASFLLAFNPLFLLFSTEVLSDVPFALCCIAILMIMEKSAGVMPLRPLLFLSLVLAAGMLLREIGFTLVVAAAGFFLLRRKWKEGLIVTAIPAALYTLWFVRNEIIVAHREIPAMTNSLLMTAHFFTPPDAGIIQEWIARALANGAIYGKLFAGLLFLPLHGWVQFDVVYLNTLPITAADRMLAIAGYPLMALTLAGALLGCVADFRRSPTALLRALFVVAYILAILVYPVNDIRFMLPVLIVLLYYLVLGVSSFQFVGGRRAARAAVYCVLVLVSFPNLLWDAEYTRNCANYNASPTDFFGQTRGLNKYPSHFTKPFPLVGEWIGRETPSTALILSQWKDIAVWAEGRKVYQADQTLPLDEFESIIRDYGVTHLVAVVQKNGAREFDMQMHATMRYAFTLKTTIANVEIYGISRRLPPSRPVDESTPFRHGMSLLLSGSYEQAREILAKARGADSLNLPVRFASAVAEEFVMNLGPAKNEFAAISAMPQSLMFAREANLHRQMIERVALAEAATVPSEKADGYVRAATLCWNLGFRVKARELTQRALAADSTYFPAMIFGVHFAMGEGDTAVALRLYSYAQRADSANPASVNFGNIFNCLGLLRTASGEKARPALFMRVCSAYRELGLSDAAIDNALLALNEDSSNVDAAVTLAGMYELRRRWSPANNILARAARLHPDETFIRERLESLQTHF